MPGDVEEGVVWQRMLRHVREGGRESSVVSRFTASLLLSYSSGCAEHPVETVPYNLSNPYPLTNQVQINPFGLRYPRRVEWCVGTTP